MSEGKVKDLKDQTAIAMLPNKQNLLKLAYLSPLRLVKVHSLTMQKRGGGDYKREAYQFESHQSEKLYDLLIPFADRADSKTPWEVWDFIAKISALIDINSWKKVIQAELLNNNITGEKEFRWVTPEDKTSP